MTRCTHCCSAVTEGIAKLGVQEVADAWAILESHGFPPEAVNWPQENIAGKLPVAIDNALTAIVGARDDLIAEVMRLREAVPQPTPDLSAGMKQPMTNKSFYGWYDDASQPVSQPSYEPPRDAPCPYCGKPIHVGDVRTHSLMYVGDYAARSYFYRTHRTCDESSQTGLDDFILDMIKRNGD